MVGVKAVRNRSAVDTKMRSFLITTGGLLFSVCAALQWNDPDPLVWMAVYGGAAVACGLDRTGKMVAAKVLATLGIVVAVYGAAYLAPAVRAGYDAAGGDIGALLFGKDGQGMAGSTGVEEARETGAGGAVGPPPPAGYF